MPGATLAASWAAVGTMTWQAVHCNPLSPELAHTLHHSKLWGFVGPAGTCQGSTARRALCAQAFLMSNELNQKIKAEERQKELQDDIRWAW